VATYKILYWQEIPTQIRVEDESDTVTAMLGDRFMALVDAQAIKEGLTATDAFLDAWHWSEEQEHEGSAHDVAAALKAELEAGKW
jgi:predicted metal-dependent hydrolase